jgi:hypothetical protein
MPLRAEAGSPIAQEVSKHHAKHHLRLDAVTDPRPGSPAIISSYHNAPERATDPPSLLVSSDYPKLSQ